MATPTYALVTPSYWRDVERCRFLLETRERWAPSSLAHYLVVARADLGLFRSMLNGRTTLIVVEDILPRWLFRVPGFRHFWFSLRTRPVKNWILQQIVKLSVPAVVPEDVLLYADSDMFFIAPFEPAAFERHGTVPLFAEPVPRGLIPAQDRWQRACSKLLGVAPAHSFETNYVSQLIWWRRSNALATVRRVEDSTGRPWQQAIGALSGFSEYILYGLHAERILGADAGQWRDETVRTLCYWGTRPLSPRDLDILKSKRQPHHHSAMVSSKSDTPIRDIRKAFSSP